MKQNMEIPGTMKSVLGNAANDRNEMDADKWAENFWRNKCDCK